MRVRVSAAWMRARLRERSPDDLFRVAMLAIVALGLFLRLHGWASNRLSFWYDEAMWAGRLLRLPLQELAIRPVGFMWLTRTVVRCFGDSELWFRFLPAVGSAGALLLTPYVASRLHASKVLRLLLVLVFALHPALIDFANEFKPYSFEVLVHLGAVALYLRYAETSRWGWLAALLCYLPLGFLFAYNLTFAYPGLLLLLLWRAWRSSARAKQVVATVAAGAVCAAVVVGVHQWSLDDVVREKTASYWGKKYDVFYEGDEQTRVDWTLHSVSDMLAMAGLRRELWSHTSLVSDETTSELGSLDRLLWVTLSAAGVLALWRQRRELLLVLVLPLVVLAVVNYLGRWPMGAFRTNLFMTAYCLPLPLQGFALLASTKRRAVALWALLGGLTLLPGFCFGFDWYGHKRLFTRDHYARKVLDKLQDYRRQQLRRPRLAGKMPLLLDPNTLVPFKFYLNDQREGRARHQRFFEEHFSVQRGKPSALMRRARKRLARGEPGVWVVSSSPADFARLEAQAETLGRVAFRERVRKQHLLLFIERKKR